MTREELERRCSDVKDAMAMYAKSFATPISMSEEQGHGVAWATGSYLECSGATHLLTAGHAFTELPEHGHLAHLPLLGGDYISITSPPELAPWPVDAATFAVPPVPKISTLRPIPPSSIDTCYLAVEGELLFWIGFPGYTLDRHDAPVDGRRRRTWFGELATTGVPMLSQAEREWDGSHISFDSEKHIAVHYPSTAKRSFDSPPVAVPNPKGMSGSVLWDTKFVRSGGGDWSPKLARVCGLVWAALDTPEVVLATKIEYLRAALPATFGLIEQIESASASSPAP